MRFHSLCDCNGRGGADESVYFHSGKPRRYLLVGFNRVSLGQFSETAVVVISQ